MKNLKKYPKCNLFPPIRKMSKWKMSPLRRKNLLKNKRNRNLPKRDPSQESNMLISLLRKRLSRRRRSLKFKNPGRLNLSKRNQWRNRNKLRRSQKSLRKLLFPNQNLRKNKLSQRNLQLRNNRKQRKKNKSSLYSLSRSNLTKRLKRKR